MKSTSISVIIPLKLEVNFTVPTVNQFHITLKHLGDFDKNTAQQQLRKIIFKPFQIHIKGQGQFKNSTYYTVYSKELIKLQNKVDKAFQQWFEPERNFVPHITIVRKKTTLPEIDQKIRVEKIKIME